ncbi:DinB family protein [Flavobacterium sp. MAH-1]|uniref:DinB family protein n=1 Tax=Flavobacterium agri TaxID=2743471 RepID=A0A7Y9C506_9FLAO|nr:DinB family protein [Flavobacterium agri]NUY80777.1 DinB family protein [Flavobacterium agri]NYA70801.1 DinB family protein [Flavobacterium agri]
MENLQIQIQPTFDAMISAIRGCDDDNFNKIPFEGSWTAGQVAEHIRLSVKGIPELFMAKTEKTDRDPEQKIPIVAGIFLDFDKKFQSPDFIYPEMKTYERESFVAFYSDYCDKLERTVAQLDMSEICLGFEIPGLGPMTRQELLAFALFHTQRHTRQMRNICNSLKFSE